MNQQQSWVSLAFCQELVVEADARAGSLIRTLANRTQTM